MSDLRKIRVMISSRSLTKVFREQLALSDVRQRLQIFLQDIRWRGPSTGGKIVEAVGRDQALFDVWIHERDMARPANRTTLDISLAEISKADVVVVLYTGEVGSAKDGQSIGICHAELQEALARRPEIVSFVRLLPTLAAATRKDEEFQDYVRRWDPPMVDVDNEAQLQRRIAELLQEQIAVLVKRGATAGSHKRDRGQALDWNRLDLADRRKVMQEALIRNLDAEKISAGTNGSPLYRATLPQAGELAFRLDAIAAALSVGPAREAVGQPHLRDHEYSADLEKHGIPGVIHMIACHRGITEIQATRILGTPDAVSVGSDFGVYVADHVQQIQFVFLANCSDETATALVLRRFKEWLTMPEPGVGVGRRGGSRRRILATLAAEQTAMVGHSDKQKSTRRTTSSSVDHDAAKTSPTTKGEQR
jgi:hypothetical protein